MDVKLYLALAGTLSLAYVTYTLLNKPKVVIIDKNLTRRICQEIKHQMMIVCITYSKAMKKIRQDNSEKIKGKAEEIFMNFRNQLSQVYVAKENLILKKYAVSREIYGKSLEKWKHDKKLLKNTEEILNMMERAINGQTPDFTVPQQVYQSFTRENLCEIYRQMVTLIGKKVTHKLQQQQQRNKNFNPNSDDDFRNAIRELAIYDVKVDFLKSKGFNQEWGCPNEIFFKYLEDQKTKDEAYEKKVVAYQKCYEKIIELVSADPRSMNDQKIDELFEKALVAPKAPVQPSAIPPVAQPIKVAPVEAPRSYVPPAKKELDQDADLEAMMMQQLLSRSQQAPKSVESSLALDESKKIGLTSSQIQNDWEAHGSLREKEISKLEQATEQVAIGKKDEELIKTEMKVVEEALKEIEENQDEQKQQTIEQPIVEAPIIDVEPIAEFVGESVVENEEKPDVVAETVQVEIKTEEVKVEVPAEGQPEIKEINTQKVVEQVTQSIVQSQEQSQEQPHEQPQEQPQEQPEKQAEEQQLQEQ